MTVWHITIVISQQAMPPLANHLTTFLDCRLCNPTHFVIVLLSMSSILSPLDVISLAHDGTVFICLSAPSIWHWHHVTHG
jgi:hypothetical protein